MTLGDWALLFVAVTVACAGVATWLAYHIGFRDGHESGRIYERNRHSTRALQAARKPTMLVQPAVPAQWQVYHPGRHAPFQPRVTVTRDTIAFAGGPATVPISHRTDSGEIRALAAGTDRWIEDMRRDENAYRRQLTS